MELIFFLIAYIIYILFCFTLYDKFFKKYPYYDSGALALIPILNIIALICLINDKEHLKYKYILNEKYDEDDVKAFTKYNKIKSFNSIVLYFTPYLNGYDIDDLHEIYELMDYDNYATYKIFEFVFEIPYIKLTGKNLKPIISIKNCKEKQYCADKQKYYRENWI